MYKDAYTIKLIMIFAIAAVCFIASILVLEGANERKNRFTEAEQEVASAWGREQRVAGPILKVNGVLRGTANEWATYYVLPESVHYQTALMPQTRSRGIYDATVYDAEIRTNGAFSASSVAPVLAQFSRIDSTRLVVAMSDTRGIEKQVHITLGSETLPFEPGSEMHVRSEDASGLHVDVPRALLVRDMPFSYSVAVKGSKSIGFAPVGNESTVEVTSAWPSPSFTGAFLPAERSVTDDGFSAVWRISSFGRSYGQSWRDSDVELDKVLASTADVGLYQHGDLYTKIDRSTKYAILFIVVTFVVFFLFEVLTAIRIHPVQYLLVGAGLALFYLLLLSLSEHIGFPIAYFSATLMIAGLIGFYSSTVLLAKRRAILIFCMLVGLYAYLYFVLLLEDYALLFGSLLLFMLLGTVMYITRNVNWFGLGAHAEKR